MPGNATLYISDPSMIGSVLFDSLNSIQSYEGLLSDDDNATGFLLKMPWGQVKMTLKSGEALNEHLNGFKGFIQSLLENEDDLVYVLSRVSYVQLALGCNITHDQEFENDVFQFLFDFNFALNGLMFLMIRFGIGLVIRCAVHITIAK